MHTSMVLFIVWLNEVNGNEILSIIQFVKRDHVFVMAVHISNVKHDSSLWYDYRR